MTYRERYVALCSKLMSFEACEKSDIQKHNAAMDELTTLFHCVEREDDKSFLGELLECDDDRVRMIVASHCLGMKMHIAASEKVLSGISANLEDPFLALEAGATLQVWKEQGYLTFA